MRFVTCFQAFVKQSGLCDQDDEQEGKNREALQEDQGPPHQDKRDHVGCPRQYREEGTLDSQLALEGGGG